MVRVSATWIDHVDANGDVSLSIGERKIPVILRTYLDVSVFPIGARYPIGALRTGNNREDREDKRKPLHEDRIEILKIGELKGRTHALPAYSVSG